MPDPAALVRQLADRDPARRKSAEKQLHDLGESAVPALAAALADRRLAGAVAERLSALGTPAAVKALLGAMDRPADANDPKDLHRLGIAHALRRAGPVAHAAAIRRRLDREPMATPLAKVLVQTLAGLGTAEAVAAAIDVFVADARFAREDFVYLLDPLRLEPVHAAVVFPRVRPLLSDPGKGNTVIVLANAFAYAGTRPHPLSGEVAGLVAALDSDIADRATLAAHALGLIGDRAAEPALTKKAGDAAADVWLQAEAAFALARNHVASGRAALERLSRDEEAGDWARRRLDELGPQKMEV
jgi:hypothetical protein